MITDEEEAKRWLRQTPGYTAETNAKLERFVARLADENQRQNLVSQASLMHVWHRHVADSAQLLGHVPRGTSTWLDLGTGAGFPGMIIAILSSAVHVTLVESRAKRAAWLDASSADLGLANVSVWHGDVAALPARTFQAISARAFAPLDRLIALAARFSTSDTTWLLPKGRSARDELGGVLGWRHMFHVEQSLTDGGAGVIVGRLLGPEERRG